MLKIRARSKKRKSIQVVYPLELDAAFYALKEFISPLECNEKYDGIPLPMNLKVILQHYFSGTKLTGQLPCGETVLFQLDVFHFSKPRLLEHLFGNKIYYYRSKRSQLHYIGYGNTDKQALTLPFAKDLDITHKNTLASKDYYVILAGTDIDAHKPEQTDAEAVKNWIQSTYIPKSYWEKSTGQRGRHGYYKLAYPRKMKLEKVTEILTDVHALLNLKRQQLGFLCEIDVPCGLPSQYSFDSTVKTLAINISDIFPDYQDVLAKLNIQSLNNDSSLYLSLTDTESKEVQHLESYTTKVSLHTSQCFKIPKFNASSDQCNMNDIKTFYSLPYYTIDYFIHLRSQLRQELGLQDTTQLLQEADASAFSFSKKNSDDSSYFSPSGEGASVCILPIVCTTSDTDTENKECEYISWEKLTKIHYTSYKYENNTKQTYMQRIEDCRSISGKVLRTNRFCWALTLKLGRVPEREEAIDEYLKQRLNENPDKNSPKRKQRFRSTLNLIERKYDKNKLGLNLTDWEDLKQLIIIELKQIFSLDNLKYTASIGKSLNIKWEELAFVYYVVYKSNLSDKGKSPDHIQKYAISYNRFKEAIVKIFGSPKHKTGGYNKNKLSRILKLLQMRKLIVKDNTYIVSRRGNCYKIKKDLIMKREAS